MGGPAETLRMVQPTRTHTTRRHDQCETRPMTPLRRSAGLWGPLSFGVAAFAAARRQPGYSHCSDHVSGLAALGEPSARLMIPGFLALGVSSLLVDTPTRTLRRVTRAAGLTTIAAGLIRVSAPRCPQPGFDPTATSSDAGHAAASIATFALWTAMPFIAAQEPRPVWYRRVARVLSVSTLATFVAAGATTRLDSPHKGFAQRAFLCSVFVFYAATSCTIPGARAPGIGRRTRTSRATG